MIQETGIKFRGRMFWIECVKDDRSVDMDIRHFCEFLEEALKSRGMVMVEMKQEKRP